MFCSRSNRSYRGGRCHGLSGRLQKDLPRPTEEAPAPRVAWWRPTASTAELLLPAPPRATPVECESFTAPPIGVQAPALSALLEEASADQDDPWIVDSAETDAAEVVVAEAEDVVEDDESAAELSADAEAAQEGGNGEEEQLQAFRSMLGSMFGIKKPATI